jgi:hypothetical protein
VYIILAILLRRQRPREAWFKASQGKSLETPPSQPIKMAGIALNFNFIDHGFFPRFAAGL